MITQKEAINLFDYKDGILYWKVKTTNSKKVGDVVGSLNAQGYFVSNVKGKHTLLHRIVFLMHHGYLPKYIDHIDGDKTNNRIENLREATNSQNMLNIRLTKSNTSGVKGVCWNKRAKKWNVRLSIDGRVRSFGLYFDINVAKFIAETMRYKYHREFANHG